MKEQIERVIADLEERMGDRNIEWKLFGPNPETYGRRHELVHAITKLKAILPQADESTAHAQADTDPLPFEPSKEDLEEETV